MKFSLPNHFWNFWLKLTCTQQSPCVPSPRNFHKQFNHITSTQMNKTGTIGASFLFLQSLPYTPRKTATPDFPLHTIPANSGWGCGGGHGAKTITPCGYSHKVLAHTLSHVLPERWVVSSWPYRWRNRSSKSSIRPSQEAYTCTYKWMRSSVCACARERLQRTVRLRIQSQIPPMSNSAL